MIRQLLPQHFPSNESRREKPVGLIAGWGSFPVEVAERIIASGRPVCCVAITDHASRELETLCDHVKWSGVGKIGAHIRYFKKHGVGQVTMAGKLFKSELLFQGSVWIKHCPDLTAIRTSAPACWVGDPTPGMTACSLPLPTPTKNTRWKSAPPPTLHRSYS